MTTSSLSDPEIEDVSVDYWLNVVRHEWLSDQTKTMMMVRFIIQAGNNTDGHTVLNYKYTNGGSVSVITFQAFHYVSELQMLVEDIFASRPQLLGKLLNKQPVSAQEFGVVVTDVDILPFTKEDLYDSQLCRYICG